MSEPSTNAQKENNKFFGFNKDILLAVVGAVVLPLVFNIGSCSNQERVEKLKRKSELLKEFSQQYSKYLTSTEELFYQECRHGEAKPIDEECRKYRVDEECRMYNESKRNDCQRMVVKRKMLDIDQPDGILTQISVLYNSPSVKVISERLSANSLVLTQLLDCVERQGGDAVDFSSLVDEADKDYQRLLAAMAREIR